MRFTPVPFGNDLYIQYGDEFGLPILGNFDPPVVAEGEAPVVGGSDRDPLDVNNDGRISAFDALLIINHMNQYGPGAPAPDYSFEQGPYLDVNRSGTRKEDLLLHPDELQKVAILRRVLADMHPVEAMELLINRAKKTKSNAEFLLSMNLG